MRALVLMDDAQASFQILRLSAVSRLSHLLCTVPHCITQEESRHFDALIEWALASIINSDGAAAACLPTPEEVANDPNVCRNQTYLGHEALRQVICLSERVDSDPSAVMRSKVQLTSATKP